MTVKEKRTFWLSILGGVIILVAAGIFKEYVSYEVNEATIARHDKLIIEHDSKIGDLEKTTATRQDLENSENRIEGNRLASEEKIMEMLKDIKKDIRELR